MFLPTTAAVASLIFTKEQETESMAFLDYLSITAIVSTIGMFLTGIAICRTIKQRGSTEGISAVPFALCCVSCFFWLRYGLLKNDRTVIFINLVGLSLEIVYTLYYYVYTIRKGSLNQMLLISLATCAAMLIYIDGMAPPYDTAVAHLGMMCLTLNILNFGAPLASMKEVMRTKSTETLPGPLIFANLIVAFQWFLYGYLVDDIYMKVPNVIGIILSLIQLSFFVIYPAPQKMVK